MAGLAALALSWGRYQDWRADLVGLIGTGAAIVPLAVGGGGVDGRVRHRRGRRGRVFVVAWHTRDRLREPPDPATAQEAATGSRAPAAGR